MSKIELDASAKVLLEAFTELDPEGASRLMKLTTLVKERDNRAIELVNQYGRKELDFEGLLAQVDGLVGPSN